ncbi:hypothetical protein [Sphingomonas sp.]|jgi:hypothetical protein|uniref:hypothetical protein n=1 Tax=Sphingomonas sp. TaxID=28214 RepID=UPI002D7F342C|nr:hypothetical protein [Sphingomonas sp.]HEU0044494.1 hypothetical protein [Sphingomonas sp.]
MIHLLLLAAGVAQEAPPQAPAFAAAPMDGAALNKATAREDVSQVAISEQTSRVSNNTINGPSVTGTATIDGNAFQNLQGLSIINANTGNNVSINAALNVNIQFTPAP